MSPNVSPLIVPVFLPHAGCPHQCVFCDQHAVTGTKAEVRGKTVIQEALKTYGRHRHTGHRPVQIAFYGGTFLGLPEQTICAWLAAADHFVQEGQVDGIRFSTRPDTIDDNRLALISQYPVSTVEIGAQSMSDRVLALSRRGHSAADTTRAVNRLKKMGLQIGIQMMVGLPGDDDETVMATGRAIAALKPAFVRIYPTIVLADSPLGAWYGQGRYHPLKLDHAVALTKTLLVHFYQNNIPVIRMGVQASVDLEMGSSVLAGPYHPAFGHLVYEALFFDAIRHRLGHYPAEGAIDIQVNPRNISKMRGLNNGNVKRLRDHFYPRQISVQSNSRIDPDSIGINGRTCRLFEEDLTAPVSPDRSLAI